MEGKAQIPNLPFRAGLLGLGEQVEFQHLVFPAVQAEGVHQVKVDVVGLQALQLVVEEEVEILLLFHREHRHFGGQVDLFPVAVPQGLAHQRLAGLVVIKIGGVDVVHAAVDGVADHADGPGLVDAVVGLPFQNRHAHAAKAQRGNLHTGISHFAVLHSEKTPLAFP